MAKDNDNPNLDPLCSEDWHHSVLVVSHGAGPSEKDAMNPTFQMLDSRLKELRYFKMIENGEEGIETSNLSLS